MFWRRKWQPITVSLPGGSHGKRSLMGYCSRDHKKLDMTEWLSTDVYTSLCSYVYNGRMLKLKLQYFSHLMQRADSFEKTLLLGKIKGGRRRGRQGEMVGWHHGLKGHRFGWTLGVGDGQGGLACCSPWGHKELNMTEGLNWTDTM